MSTEASALLTEAQLSEYLQKPAGTLRNWRMLRQGPPYVKVGHNVRYRMSDVQSWLDGQRREGAA